LVSVPLWFILYSYNLFLHSIISHSIQMVYPVLFLFIYFVLYIHSFVNNFLNKVYFNTDFIAPDGCFSEQQIYGGDVKVLSLFSYILILFLLSYQPPSLPHSFPSSSIFFSLRFSHFVIGLRHDDPSFRFFLHLFTFIFIFLFFSSVFFFAS
jgi:hypothetical protein